MMPGQPLENYQDEIYLAGLAGTVPALPTDLTQLEDAARDRLSPQAWGYIAGGAGSGDTVRENRAALAQPGRPGPGGARPAAVTGKRPPGSTRNWPLIRAGNGQPGRMAASRDLS